MLKNINHIITDVWNKTLNVNLNQNFSIVGFNIISLITVSVDEKSL